MNKRIKELDGIRGIAILMVMVWHYFTCQLQELDPGSLLFYLHSSTAFFWSGVDLFFVLSGFLIGGIILDNHTKQSFLKTFWIRRICRIFPVLFLLLFLCWITGLFLDKEQFAWLFDGLMPWWTYVSFTQNIAMGLNDSFGGHFLGITWSLAVEEQFYLVAPLLIVIFGRTVWIRSLIPLILTAFLLRLAFLGFHAYVNMVFRMDSLLLGVLVASIYRKKEVWEFLSTNKGAVLETFLCLLLITPYVMSLKLGGMFNLSLVAGVYSIFLLVTLLYQSSGLTRILRTRFLCFWGSIAYGLYMYHQAISGLLHGWLRNGEEPGLNSGYAASITGIAFLLSTVIAWVSFKYFESVFLRLGNRQQYGANKST